MRLKRISRSRLSALPVILELKARKVTEFKKNIPWPFEMVVAFFGYKLIASFRKTKDVTE